jgi:tetratricopeptide (TPR) repeat protein
MRPNVHHTARLTLTLLIGCVATQLFGAEEAGHRAASNVIAHAETDLASARQRSAAEITNCVAAWELGRACFVMGGLSASPATQEKLYADGVTACRHSVALDPKCGLAHYYLGMNIGRVADLKRNLAAFGMVKEVEKEFERARELDETLCYGGPDRNLGLLYLHAPGWPISVGSKKLARQHLERAVKLAPDFPENRLNLAEAYLQWREPKLFHQELEALRQLWPQAKTNFTGVAWEEDWADWESRRAQLLKPAAQ